MKNGIVGEFKGYRINGKTYDPYGNEIIEVHEKDCLCCCEALFTRTP